MLAGAIRQCLLDLLGSRVAEAMDFYLDPTLAAADPKQYAQRLRSLTGQSPGDVILRRIEATLCNKLGVAGKEWASFEECVTQLKGESSAQNRHSMPPVI